jgi:hypothetical protein
MKSLTLLAAFTLLGMAAVANAATAESQALATVRQFVDSFNKGDAKAAAATLTPGGAVIIDDVAPHLFTGANAFDTWSKALGDKDAAEGNAHQSVALGKPTRIIMGADRGYRVAPAVYNFKTKGVAMRETAQMVISLQKSPSGWQIAGFAWAGSKPRPRRGSRKIGASRRQRPCAKPQSCDRIGAQATSFARVFSRALAGLVEGRRRAGMPRNWAGNDR